MKTGAKVDAKFMEQADKYLKAIESGIEQQDDQAVRTAADRIANAAQKFERTMRERAKKAKTKADATMRVDEHVKWSKTVNDKYKKTLKDNKKLRHFSAASPENLDAQE